MYSERTTGDLKKAPEAGDQAKIRMMPRRGTWLMKPLAMLLSIAWVLAIIVRLTVRDSGGTISTLIYYMSPLMLLSVGAALITGVTGQDGGYLAEFLVSTGAYLVAFNALFWDLVLSGTVSNTRGVQPAACCKSVHATCFVLEYWGSHLER